MPTAGAYAIISANGRISESQPRHLEQATCASSLPTAVAYAIIGANVRISESQPRPSRTGHLRFEQGSRARYKGEP